MSTRFSDGESWGSQILTAAIIAGSALLLYAFVASPVIEGSPQPVSSSVGQAMATAPASNSVS